MGNIDELNQIIDLYINSVDKEKIYALLSDPGLQFFRTIEEIIELSTLYENILETETYLTFITGRNKYPELNKKIYDVIINLNKLVDKDFTFEIQKQKIHKILDLYQFHVIEIDRKEKTKC